MSFRVSALAAFALIAALLAAAVDAKSNFRPCVEIYRKCHADANRKHAGAIADIESKSAAYNVCIYEHQMAITFGSQVRPNSTLNKKEPLGRCRLVNKLIHLRAAGMSMLRTCGSFS